MWAFCASVNQFNFCVHRSQNTQHPKGSWSWASDQMIVLVLLRKKKFIPSKRSIGSKSRDSKNSLYRRKPYVCLIVWFKLKRLNRSKHI